MIPLTDWLPRLDVRNSCYAFYSKHTNRNLVVAVLRNVWSYQK